MGVAPVRVAPTGTVAFHIEQIFGCEAEAGQWTGTPTLKIGIAVGAECVIRINHCAEFLH
jgi:hypothetical protein